MVYALIDLILTFAFSSNKESKWTKYGDSAKYLEVVPSEQFYPNSCKLETFGLIFERAIRR